MEYKQLHFSTRAHWRKWLRDNHHSCKGIWFVFYKKHTGKKTISYNDAVEEALCYGWIDSIIKSIDHEKYMQKFTPRKNSNKWSPTNIKRLKKLIQEKRITKFGLAKFSEDILKEEPKKEPSTSEGLPAIILRELKKHPKAFEFFNSLAPSYREIYIGWITSAKQETTRTKRLNEAILLLEQNKKLGLK
jgi:uncharacterized protein YdeI (YjbR/CyaY-like superfamily)